MMDLKRKKVKSKIIWIKKKRIKSEGDEGKNYISLRIISVIDKNKFN